MATFARVAGPSTPFVLLAVGFVLALLVISGFRAIKPTQARALAGLNLIDWLLVLAIASVFAALLVPPPAKVWPRREADQQHKAIEANVEGGGAPRK